MYFPAQLARFFTVTLHEADTPLPSLALQMIVAVPWPTAVTSPSSETVAMAALSDVHETVLSVASSGRIVAVSWFSSPNIIESSVSLNAIDVTFLSCCSVNSTMFLNLFQPSAS